MAVIVLVGGMGCGDRTAPPADDKGTVAPPASDKEDSEQKTEPPADVKREMREAPRAVRSLADERMSTFKGMVREWQRVLDTEIEELQEKAKATGDDGEERWREISDALGAKRAVAKEKLRALEASTEKTWDKAKEEAEQAMEDVRAYLAREAESWAIRE